MDKEFDFGTDDNINWEAYVAECMKTEPVSLGKVADKNLTVSDHGIIGMMTEAGELLDQMKKHWFYGRELDVVNIKEELGDILWYAAIWYHESKLDFPFKRESALTAENPDDYYGLCKLTSDLWYSSYIDDSIKCRDAFYGIVCTVMLIAKRYELSFVGILETNIRKLRKRFPDSFDLDKAINRDLDAEREILEG